MNRRDFLLAAAAPFAVPAYGHLLAETGGSSDPWSPGELMDPANLASQLRSGQKPTIVSVAFPFLYRQRHITGAQFAGPGSKPEGIRALRAAVANIPKDHPVVIYCGCCPMVHCPNIRPAYRTLKDLNFTNVRILDLPTNFHTDWTAKGYPVEPQVAS